MFWRWKEWRGDKKWLGKIAIFIVQFYIIVIAQKKGRKGFFLPRKYGRFIQSEMVMMIHNGPTDKPDEMQSLEALTLKIENKNW